jgi:hypothetical protein
MNVPIDVFLMITQKKRDTFLFIITYICPILGFGQNDSLWKAKPNIEISGFADVFYTYDFNQPSSHSRQDFLFNHNRHNELNLNLGMIKFAISHPKYRSNLALQTGTYAQDNYVSESKVLRYILESNVGFSLNGNNNLWIDVGVLPSYIGSENAISSENPTLTRSLLAENSPYFITGAKLTFLPNKKWEIAGLIMNGWQRIQWVKHNSLPSLGTQVLHKPSENISFNWSSFIGTDDPDSIRRLRFFNNFFAQIKGNNWDWTIGFDYGVQQKSKNEVFYDAWFSPIVIARYHINTVWKTAFRAELYEDRNALIIPDYSPSTFSTQSISLNLDYNHSPQIICRLEGRYMYNNDSIFEIKNGLSSHNFIIATSISVKFTRRIKRKII